MEYPWILPTPSPSNGPIEMNVPLPVPMIAYQENIDCVAEPSPSSSRTEEEYPYVLPAWEVESSHVHDCLDDVFHRMKPLLRPCLGLSHLGKSYIIDLIFFPSSTIWSVKTLGRFLARIRGNLGSKMGLIIK